MFKGKQMLIYGAYATEHEAKKKHELISGSFIRKRKIRGNIRYVVMKRKK